jgi:hypothetical protein
VTPRASLRRTGATGGGRYRIINARDTATPRCGWLLRPLLRSYPHRVGHRRRCRNTENQWRFWWEAGSCFVTQRCAFWFFFFWGGDSVFYPPPPPPRAAAQRIENGIKKRASAMGVQCGMSIKTVQFTSTVTQVCWGKS